MASSEPKKAKRDDTQPQREMAEVRKFIPDPEKKEKKPPKEKRRENMLFSDPSKKTEEVIPNPDPQFPERPFDPHVQLVINSVRDEITEKTGIRRDYFEGIRFCQYVSEENAYYVKLFQEDDKYMHVKITKPFVPVLEDKWDIPFHVTDVRMDKNDGDKVRIWDKEAETLDRERRQFFYNETWDVKDRELGVAKPKINHREFELLAELDLV